MKKLITILVLLLTQMVFGQTATPPAAGDGSIESPYQIASLENLYWIAASDAVVPSPTKVTRWAAHYIQTTDIDASATSGWPSGGWTPIGNNVTNFTGSYNGQGHTISGIKTNRQVNFQGLFGAVLSATIQNLGVTSVNIAGLQYFGGLAGAVNNSTVSKCFSTGSVSLGGSTSYLKAGGLIGVIENSSDVSNCYSTANIENQREIGGFAYSITSSTVSNCYSIGSAGGISDYGGFVGAVSGATVTNCFWDTQTSETEISAGGTGKNTTEMTTQSTFLDAGWSSAIWYMDAGFNSGYPYLEWQNPGGSPLPVELTSFTASVSGGKVTLNWQTATEVNNYGFEIERTSPRPSPQGEGCEAGRGWENIGFVAGHGNSNSHKEYSFTDETVISGKSFYRLKQLDNNGEFSYSSELEVNIETIPTEFALYQNYPNPFNPSTKIKYSIPSVETHGGASVQNISLKIYDILGNEVAVLVDDNLSAGNYEIEFDASQLPSGVYFYSLSAGDFHQTKKMIVLK